MDWSSLKAIVRRTGNPLIVTDEVGEPLIILPLSLYQGSAVELKEGSHEVLPAPVEPPKPPKTEHRSLLEQIAGERPAELAQPTSTPMTQSTEKVSTPMVQWTLPEAVMEPIPSTPEVKSTAPAIISLEEAFVFMQ